MPPGNVTWEQVLQFLQLFQPIVIGLVVFALREARLLAKEVRIIKTQQYKHAVYVAAKFGDPLPSYMEK